VASTFQHTIRPRHSRSVSLRSTRTCHTRRTPSITRRLADLSSSTVNISHHTKAVQARNTTLSSLRNRLTWCELPKRGEALYFEVVSLVRAYHRLRDWRSRTLGLTQRHRAAL
jgi:hypothetical protein